MGKVTLCASCNHYRNHFDLTKVFAIRDVMEGARGGSCEPPFEYFEKIPGARGGSHSFMSWAPNASPLDQGKSK